MKRPVSRFTSSPSLAGGGRSQWPGRAGSTGALACSEPGAWIWGGGEAAVVMRDRLHD
jgi:hypothetical protein